MESMFSVLMYAVSGVLGAGSAAAMLAGGYPSPAFAVGVNLLTVAVNGALCATVARRWSDAVNSAFDLGVDVGERRAKSAVRPYIMRNRKDR